MQSAGSYSALMAKMITLVLVPEVVTVTSVSASRAEPRSIVYLSLEATVRVYGELLLAPAFAAGSTE